MTHRLVPIAACATILIGGAAAAETITYGTQMPDVHPLMYGGVVPYSEAVEAAGTGVDFDIQSGGTVVSTSTVLDSIGSGLVGGGSVADNYVGAALPHSSLISALGMDDVSAMAGSAAVTELQLLNCPGCVEDMADSGAVTLGVGRLSPYLMYCRDNVRSSDDMRGKNIKAAGSWVLVAEELGATAANVQISEVYEALQRGLVDCAIGPETWLEDRSLWDFAKVVFETPLGAFTGHHIMTLNLDLYEDLDPEARRTLLDNMPTLLVNSAVAIEEADARVRETAAGHGVSYVADDQGLADALQRARARAEETAVSRAAADNIEDPQALVAKYRELIDKWTAIEAEVAGDKDAFAARVKSEIYDKLPES